MNTPLVERWRISTLRVAALFGLLFTLCMAAMLGLIYWQTTVYMEKRVDRIIRTYAERFAHTAREDLPGAIAEAIRYDPRKVDLYGLFNPTGERLAGNLLRVPAEMAADGQIRLSQDRELVAHRGAGASPPLVRALAVRLDNGDLFVLGRDISELAEIRAILLNGLFVGGGLILVLGLSAGFALSVRPLRRIQEIRDVTARIMLGDLSLRIPLAGQRDELDMLASTVNRMLEEIERLLAEVKSVSDNVAHDLRTPLTRLRLLLSRAQQQAGAGTAQRDVFDKALAETDALLGRFRALLRISEIETSVRRAGFDMIEPARVIEQVAELFEPLAEERGLSLHVDIDPVPRLFADPELLVEALSNLVDNAIKFTPPGGKVTLGLHQGADGTAIDVIDTGTGIDPEERELVCRRHYRGGQRGSDGRGAAPGYGLGLSIVVAIVRLHGFVLEFQDSPVGTHLRIRCPR